MLFAHRAGHTERITMGRLNDIMGSVFGGFGTKASAVARYIAVTGAGNPVWTPRRFDKMADEGYAKNVVAYRCIDEIAKAVSQVPILLYKRDSEGERREVHQHPVLDLLRRPNPTQSGTRLLYDLTNFLCIAGNAYLEGVGPDTGPNAGRYKELWTKRPDRMQVIPGVYGVEGYQHDINGHQHRWKVDPITQQSGIKHFKLFHPLNDWYGMSPIEAAAYSIDTHNRTSEWNKSLLDNAAQPSGIMRSERQMTDVQYNRMKKDIKEKFSGSRNAGKPLLLENGLEWQQMSFSPKDMDFLNSKHTAARDVCNAFGVPPMLLAIPGDNTFSNQREARMAFFDVTVTFYLTLLVDELNSWLMPSYGDESLELDYDLDEVPAMALRREQLFERAEKSTFLQLNEKRALAGFDPVEGGDVLLVPTTQTTLERVSSGENITKPEPAGGAKPAKKPGGGGATDGKVKALSLTLKSIRDELNLSADELALWLEGEGLSSAKAAILAELTVEQNS